MNSKTNTYYRIYLRISRKFLDIIKLKFYQFDIHGSSIFRLKTDISSFLNKCFEGIK
jgi:hypothetical protein